MTGAVTAVVVTTGPVPAHLDATTTVAASVATTTGPPAVAPAVSAVTTGTATVARVVTTAGRPVVASVVMTTVVVAPAVASVVMTTVVVAPAVASVVMTTGAAVPVVGSGVMTVIGIVIVGRVVMMTVVGTGVVSSVMTAVAVPVAASSGATTGRVVRVATTTGPPVAGSVAMTTGPPVVASVAMTTAVAVASGVTTTAVVASSVVTTGRAAPVATTTGPPVVGSVVMTGIGIGIVGRVVMTTVVGTGVVSSVMTAVAVPVVASSGAVVSSVMTAVAVPVVASSGAFRRDDRDRDRDREPIKRLPIPDDVTGDEIDKDVRQELMSLPKTLAEDVARNLVMVARLIDEDPEEAYAYSRIALRLASRVAAVREAAGFAAYATQKYAEALAEFRAARRMTGSVDLWPVMADCERGLGRPERAMAMAGDPEVQKLDKAGQVEMRLVAAGARRDMGQIDAAIVTLQSSELASNSVQPWTPRLRYAYADALLEAGREDEAREWFGKALEADKDGSTDASDRLAELDGVEFVDVLGDDDDDAADEVAPRAEDRSDAREDEDDEDDVDLDGPADGSAKA